MENGDPDRDLFRSQVGPVQRIQNDRVRAAPRRHRSAAAEQARREAAENRSRDPNPLTLPAEVPLVGPHDVVGNRKDGVQEGVFRKLRLGKYEVQARLDLHQVTLADARRQTDAFLRESHERGLRTVMITHGKGRHSPEPARMKSHVLHWLAEHPLVLAWHTAIPAHGGAGSTYVLLRKSAEQKKKTRERFTKGA